MASVLGPMLFYERSRVAEIHPMDKRIRLLALDENDATPLYMQLARKLTSAIEAAQWLAGERLPSERSLVESLGISRVTARRALEVLEEEGTIQRNPGQGTFIAPRFSRPLSKLDNFSEMVRPKGFIPSSELISFERRPPTREEAIALGLKPKDEVVCITRLRKAGATVVACDISTLISGVLSDASRMGESLYAYLDQTGQPIVRATQHFRALVADEDLSRRLAISVGAPLVLVSRVGYTHGDKALELTKNYCVNDYYDFVIELTR